jgi:hypothetical protein
MGGRGNGVPRRADGKGDVLRLLGSEPKSAANICGTLIKFLSPDHAAPAPYWKSTGTINFGSASIGFP